MRVEPSTRWFTKRGEHIVRRKAGAHDMFSGPEVLKSRPRGGLSSAVAYAAGCAALAALLALTTPSARADEMRYQFTNPSFGGNPFNSSHLLAVANAQNDNDKPSTASQQSQADQFVRLLQSRLLSALASQVSEAILGENAQESGRIVYGSQTVEWETLLDAIKLTITEADTGAVTVIEIPTVNGGG